MRIVEKTLLMHPVSHAGIAVPPAPSRSSANCAGVSAILPSFAEGLLSQPFLMRLLNRLGEL
jgi:hypothetical protein